MRHRKTSSALILTKILSGSRTLILPNFTGRCYGLCQQWLATPSWWRASSNAIQSLQHSYLKSLTSEDAKPSNPIPIKDLIYVHGEPTVLWEEDMDNMIIQEDLQYAVIGKFAYCWSELEEICRILPIQCEIKAECKIGFLRERHELIRLTTLENYVHLMSKPAYFLRAKDRYYQMRALYGSHDSIQRQKQPLH